MNIAKSERRKEGVLSWCVSHLSFLLFAFSTLIYLLTMDRSSSWWDCGEFITTGWILGVGHPPGAPVYQLLSHLFMLLSFGNPMLVAPLSNAFSALCGGATVGLLYLTLREFEVRPFGAAVGALCYLFCDTVWFSAVESEVYAPAMLFCALDVWLALRWRRTSNARLLVVLGLMLGLGIGVHLMTLLVVPALALIVIPKVAKTSSFPSLFRVLVVAFLFFLLGLSPYAIVPIRAASNPPINEMKDGFGAYLKRDQYEKAPLYPRMWRERDSANWRQWNLGAKGVAGEVVYGVGYQLGYMYGRYLMNNFIGRMTNHERPRLALFILPLLLAVAGIWFHRKRNRLDYWVVMLLFLFGGVILNIYLNHPCYEPRSRDYVYVLSYYAVALWIGVGADCLPPRWWRWLALLAPLTLAIGNWSDHDRSRSHSVHDIAANHLESCDPDAILITLGDNDTFPLWYLQQVEGRRTDVDVYNIGLTGWSKVQRIIGEAGDRPVYFTQYFVDRYANLFPNQLRCEGFCWRLCPGVGHDLTPIVHDGIEWHITDREYIDRVSANFYSKWRSIHGPLPFDR